MTTVQIALLLGVVIGVFVVGGALLVAEVWHAVRSGEDRS